MTAPTTRTKEPNRREPAPESGLARTDEALADRRTFRLNATQWKAFTAALHATPRALPRLKQLLEEPGFFGGAPNR